MQNEQKCTLPAATIYIPYIHNRVSHIIAYVLMESFREKKKTVKRKNNQEITTLKIGLI